MRSTRHVFAALGALYASGSPAIPADTPPALRKIVLKLGTSGDSSVTALRAFYKEHRLGSNQATLSRYVSFAMVVGPPPKFEYLVPQEGLPPDVSDLDGFQKLLAEFYAQEQINELWQQVKPIYDSEVDQLRGPVSGVVTIATAYTRRMGRFEGTRTFTVNVDPLIGSMTNFRIYSQRYEIAVNPAVPGTMPEIRHAFLHFLLDPFPFDDRADVDSKRYLLNYAVKAPRLPELYKYDIVSYVDECLVRAVELHLRGVAGGTNCAVFAARDQVACLVATSRPLGEVARDLRMLIPAAEWPARWARVPRIHYLDSDKLDLRWASEALDSREDRDVGAPSATFTVPSFLVGAWRRFAPLFSEDADFFASGGDSLTAMELLEAIYNETGIDIDLADFLTEPTLLKLADVIQSSPS